MTKLRINAPAELAAPLLERFAQLGYDILLIEAAREEAIAAANAKADEAVVPLIKEQGELREQLQPWWWRMGATLLKGTRKTIELGGCMIGSKSGRTKLAFANGDDKAAVEALEAHRWAKPYVRVKAEVDKVATLKALAGKHGGQLAALGFSAPTADEVFVLERVTQPGTLG